MDRTATETVIMLCLAHARQRIEHAAGIATAADACAASGQIAQAVEVALGIEQPCYEATRLLDAASLLNRIITE